MHVREFMTEKIVDMHVSFVFGGGGCKQRKVFSMTMIEESSWYSAISNGVTAGQRKNFGCRLMAVLAQIIWRE